MEHSVNKALYKIGVGIEGKIEELYAQIEKSESHLVNTVWGRNYAYKRKYLEESIRELYKVADSLQETWDLLNNILY